MPKIDLSQFAEAKKDIREIIFEPASLVETGASSSPQKAKKKNKEVQIAFYLTREDSARLNIIHSMLQAENGVAISRADRVRNLVLAFIEEHRHLLPSKTNTAELDG
jgi:hypothetical protein